MPGKTVIVLGGGIGGLVAANEARRLLPQQHRVVLVEKSAVHAFAPSFLWLMVGDRKPAQVTRAVQHLVRPGIEVLPAEVRAIDLTRGHIETNGKALSYDYLIVALGAELAPEVFPGLAEGAHTFYTFEGAAKLRHALQDFSGGKVAVVVTALPYKCPGAPHEGAMLLASFFRRYGLAGKVDLHLFTPEPQPLPVAGPELGDAVRKMLEARGIAFHALHQLTAVNAQTRELQFAGKEAFGYDLCVAIPPHRGARLLREAALANEAGWVPVDRATLLTRHENVYAIGDATAIALPGRWKPDVPLMLPKAGVFAHAQGLVVARRIAAQISGTEAKEEFCGDGYCMLEAGEDLAGFAFGDFFSEPSPQVQFRKIGKPWHLGKVLLEQWWLAPFGLRRQALQLVLTLGSKALRVPVAL